MTPERLPESDLALEIDQSLRIIIQRLADLSHRVDFLESALLPGPAPSRVDTARAAAARTGAESLRPDLESIESALDSVMSSIEGNRAVPTPPPLEPVVVDLSVGRTTPRAATRSSGWRPVATKPRS